MVRKRQKLEPSREWCENRTWRFVSSLKLRLKTVRHISKIYQHKKLLRHSLWIIMKPGDIVLRNFCSISEVISKYAVIFGSLNIYNMFSISILKLNWFGKLGNIWPTRFKEMKWNVLRIIFFFFYLGWNWSWQMKYIFHIWINMRTKYYVWMEEKSWISWLSKWEYMLKFDTKPLENNESRSNFH